MRTNLTSNIVNMIGNYILIQGNLGAPALGIRGAAIATVLGTVVACIMSVFSIMNKEIFVSIPYIIRKKIRISLQPVKSMFRIGGSAFIEQLLLRVGFMIVAVLAANLGTEQFAAHQVGMNIMALSFSFGDGLQVAAVALIGQSLGQGKPNLAKKYGRICRYMGGGISIILSVFYLIFGKSYYQMFFAEEEIVSYGVQIMQLMVFIVLLQIGQVIYMGCLRGAGDVLFTTFASTLSVTIIRPLSSYLFCYVFGMGVIGIWVGVTCDQICRYILTFYRFRTGKWMRIKI